MTLDLFYFLLGTAAVVTGVCVVMNNLFHAKYAALVTAGNTELLKEIAALKADIGIKHVVVTSAIDAIPTPPVVVQTVAPVAPAPVPAPTPLKLTDTNAQGGGFGGYDPAYGNSAKTFQDALVVDWNTVTPSLVQRLGASYDAILKDGISGKALSNDEKAALVYCSGREVPQTIKTAIQLAGG